MISVKQATAHAFRNLMKGNAMDNNSLINLAENVAYHGDLEQFESRIRNLLGDRSNLSAATIDRVDYAQLRADILGEDIPDVPDGPEEMPRYQRIISDLRAAILSDELVSGAKLPSTTDLMNQYNVSSTVVKAAFAELKATGEIRGEQGRGLFVVGSEPETAPKPRKAPAAQSITVPIVRALEGTWNAIQRHHEDVPPVVVAVGAGSIGAHKGTITNGHFAAHRWVRGDNGEQISELFMGGERLQHGARAVLETLLHEAAHGLAFTRKIQDTSRQGRFHNGEFRKLAEELGLSANKFGTAQHAKGEIDDERFKKVARTFGASETTATDDTLKRYAKQLAALEKALVVFRRSEDYFSSAGTLTTTGGNGSGGEDEEGTTGPDGRMGTGRKSNNNGLSLVCGCGRKIRASVSVYELGAIMCGLCQTEFEEA